MEDCETASGFIPPWLADLEVAPVVAGVGAAVTGYNQMQTADEWDGRVRTCGSVGPHGDVGDIPCPSNPDEGGEMMPLGLGVVLAIAGGVATRDGAQ